MMSDHFNGLRRAALVLALAAGCSSETRLRDAGGNDGTDDGDGEQASPDAGKRDAGAARDARTGPRPDTGSATATPVACAKAELTTQRVVPSVWLLIDGSGSMSGALAGLTGPSRFAVLRAALLDPVTGLVSKLASSVAFGLLIYDGGVSPPGVYLEGLCPRVIVVPPALDNYQAIAAAYPAEPTGASTPTHYALLDLQKRITAAASSDPSFVLLATDGKPNLCDFHDGIPASVLTEQEAVDTVAQLATAGTKTYALSMAGDDADLQAHLQAVAQAGGTGSNVFSPSNQDALVDALTQIFGGTQSCAVKVEGTIVAGKECSGDVTLNGQPLACDAADGYRIGADKQTLELQGAACAALRREPESQLSASFACDDVILL
jgi:hypothetical protein